ncbi:MAG: sensor histidine kinase [Solirubrobacteraceae bacterium]
MSSAATVAGWVAAGIAAALTVAVRRALSTRMEAVARACHELRGPITAARLGLSFGQRAGELSPSRLRAIDTELGRATLALQDLADLRRRDPPQLRALERVDLRELMVDCVQAADGLADDLGVTTTVGWDGPPVALWGDRLRLAQALGNLVTNAVEHGGGLVRARGVVAPGLVRIEIADQGPGLPVPVAELIRRPRQGRGARGRGLAIAAAIVEAHGGRVAAAPVIHGGCVVMELPLPPPAAASDRA